MKKGIIISLLLLLMSSVLAQVQFDGRVVRTNLNSFVNQLTKKGYSIAEQSTGTCVLSGDYLRKYPTSVKVTTDYDSASVIEVEAHFEFQTEEESLNAFNEIFESQKQNFQWSKMGSSCQAKTNRYFVVMFFETPNSFLIKLHLNELPPSHTVYCEIVGTEKLNGKLKVAVDYGQEGGQYLLGFIFSSGNTLVDENGETLEFNTMVDAMNYMGTLGWVFVQAYAVTAYEHTHIYHWLLKKEIVEGDVINDNFKIRSEIKK